MSNETGHENITVKVFADLRQFQEPETSFPVDGPIRISSVMENLPFPPEKIKLIFINGRHASTEDLVFPGDVLALFPPVGGG